MALLYGIIHRCGGKYRKRRQKKMLPNSKANAQNQVIYKKIKILEVVSTMLTA
jgi:hypothetical protein